MHCTASLQNTTEATLRAEFIRKGWKNPGYHYVVFPEGRIVQMLDESGVANGVKGYNLTAIHVAYVGGIELRPGGHGYRAVDNRTAEQKAAIRQLLMELRHRYPKARILGHRDISPDENHNGKVDSWERIKECPCFDAIPEYQDL